MLTSIKNTITRAYNGNPQSVRALNQTRTNVNTQFGQGAWKEVIARIMSQPKNQNAYGYGYDYMDHQLQQGQTLQPVRSSSRLSDRVVKK